MFDFQFYFGSVLNHLLIFNVKPVLLLTPIHLPTCIMHLGMKHYAALRGSLFPDLDLTFITGFTAHRFDDVIFVGPDLVIIDLQTADVPAAHVRVVEVIFPHLLEVHDHVTETSNTQTPVTSKHYWFSAMEWRWMEMKGEFIKTTDALIHSLTNCLFDRLIILFIAWLIGALADWFGHGWMDGCSYLPGESPFSSK